MGKLKYFQSADNSTNKIQWYLGFNYCNGCVAFCAFLGMAAARVNTSNYHWNVNLD